MEKIILSPPFSNVYPNIKGCTRIVGTYTLNRRKGMHRVLTTLKKTENGWLNSVGLRNPGIEKYNKKNAIVSIAMQDISEWPYFLKIIKQKTQKYNIQGIEFNVSCPNHNITNITSKIVKEAKTELKYVIIKIPHKSPEYLLDEFCNLNTDIIHISNSKKTNLGALSGKSLIEQNISDIIYIKEKFGNDKKVIAGGGIYSYNDLIRYRNAGADFFSLSTSLINPFKTYNIIKQSRYL
tara:strand:- start:2140 stop:2850 length:711 start_codon:yes stop_codon:yes gene_type:complete